jgi:uncharacterized repeat protein (TIGR03803 family)
MRITHLLAVCFLGVTLSAWAQGYQLQVVAEFDGTNGANPGAGLLAAGGGVYYGTAYSGGASNYGTVFRVTTNGALADVASFALTNGSNPNAALVSGGDGYFYGTTYYGGLGGLKGSVFRVATNGNLSTLVSFTSFTGKNPNAAVTPGGGGVFYGTTSLGGTNGNGTVFKVTTNGSLATLVDFDISVNGAYPNAALVWGGDGLLYGTTSQGGTFDRGTAFCLTTNGSLTKLATFDGTNGWRPNTLTRVGNLFYGTTYRGGAFDYGTFFKMTTNGTVSVLASFDVTNGIMPTSALVAGSDGRFYGTAYQGGGDVSGKGTVFSVTTNGLISALAVFDGTNGANPVGQLTFGDGGNLYGVTSLGGAYDKGVVFSLVPQSPPATNGTPWISIQPHDLYVPIKIYTNLSVVAEGAGKLGYQWFKSGKLIRGQTNSTLTFNPISTRSKGAYFVVVSDSYGAITSATVNVTAIKPPKLKITYPKSGQRWTNDLFSVSGTVKSGGIMSNVLYSLNGAAWSNAVTQNRWTNWTASFSMVPGTNVVAVFALDAAGGRSATNYVRIQYVVPRQLQLGMSGVGTFTPNYSNAWLEVGRNYTITAKPAAGYVFSNWSGDIVSSQPKLTFMMQSNLTLVANFTAPSQPSARAVVPSSVQIRLSGKPSAPGRGIRLELEVGGALNGRVEYSTDLIHWTTLTNFSGCNETLPIEDPASLEAPRRFYRIVAP